ncbi:mesoderm induction early response protein 1 [Aplysia californica]|uniref:Mesoderm induction early response protein 1 n=1 Tax=Aplysia californica TaxID=6500 RepID=A0ABM0K0N4_APLCA|nr:mesoderm induction early response protein 1 [Aplysia californica]
MAEVARSETSSPDTDKDFDPSADMMVHEYDDERTLDEEEAMTSGESCTGELDDLQKESEMPIEELLAQYSSVPGALEDIADNSRSASSSSSEEEILENKDLTLDKEVISRDLLNNAATAEDRDISVNELIQNVSRSQTLSQTERLLRSTSQQESDESESSSEDENCEPVEEHKKTIQVGSDFQAVIPVGLSAYGDAPAYENEDRLLWDPSKIKDENALNDYLCNVQKEMERKLHPVASIPRGKHIRDDEQALFLLLQCDNNIEEAERRRKMQAVPPTDVMSLWSEDECRNFEDGLRLYGKSFHEIHHNKVRTRSVFELVHFYYLWKKTERHDVFAAKTRAEKRKYSLNPGVTDHMDRFLEEQEVELSQSMIPQVADLKPESAEDGESKPLSSVFSTGKTTIYSPSKPFDRNPMRGDPAAAQKRLHPHHHHEVNGSSSIMEHSLEHSTPKKQKLDSFPSSGDQHTPKKPKMLDTIPECSLMKPPLDSLSGQSPLPASALPAPSLCNQSLPQPESASEQGNGPKHIEKTTNPAPVAADTGLTSSMPPTSSDIPTADGVNGSGHSENPAVSALPTNSPCKASSSSSSAVKSAKSVVGSGDILGIDIANCMRKPVAAESAVIQ